MIRERSDGAIVTDSTTCACVVQVDLVDILFIVAVSIKHHIT